MASTFSLYYGPIIAAYGQELNGPYSYPDGYHGVMAPSAIDNTTALYIDYLITAVFNMSDAAVAGTISIWAGAKLYGSTWMPPFNSVALKSLVHRAEVMRCVGVVSYTPTVPASAFAVHLAPTSLAACFGGVVPEEFRFWVNYTTEGFTMTSGNVYYQGIGYVAG